MKPLLSLMLVTAMTCSMVNAYPSNLWRCENDEAICYISSKNGRVSGISCKFKEQEYKKNVIHEYKTDDTQNNLRITDE